jgi:cytochrome oxidase assembly protein ShyY1
VAAARQALLPWAAVPATSASDARFLLRPRWLLSHVLVVALAVTMVSLGFWQLRRLDEKRERNALIEARLDQPVAPVDELLTPGDGDGAVADARFREVTAAGTYDDGATVVVRNRSLDGAAGAWLVTPLVLDDGTRVGVLRGFVSFAPDGSVVEAPAPAGEVTIEGLVVDPDSFDGTAPQDLAPLLAADDVAPGLVLAERSSPPEPSAADATTAGPESILAVPPPELTEGPHLGYAAQWFIFSAIAIGGYPLVLRRVVARRGKEVDDDPEGGGDGGDGTDPPGGRGGPGADDLDAELDDLLRQGG